jgi:hypothetical protein
VTIDFKPNEWAILLVVEIFVSSGKLNKSSRSGMLDPSMRSRYFA